LKGYNKLVEKLDKAINLISNLRLLTFIIGAALVGLFYYYRIYYLSVSALVLFLFLFISLAVMHDRVINYKKFALVFCDINTDSLKRITDKWHEFKDSGEEFLNIEHRYSYDLDIFGKGSLFQLINTACTSFGRERLSDILSTTPKTQDEVAKRQESVKELAYYLGWRQKFQAEGKMIHDISLPTGKLIKWAAGRNSIYSSRWMIAIFKTLPVLTIGMFIVSVSTHLIPYYFYAATLVLQILLVIIKITEKSKILQEVYTYKDNIKAYSRMLELIEKKTFKSKYLCERKEKIYTSGIKPSKQIKNLEKIAEAISYRNSSIYIILNILFLWDYQCLIALERWKDASGKKLELWLGTIGEFEALSSLAVINHDHPDWCIPEVIDDRPLVKSEGMGHPLLHKPVHNNFQITGPEKILLITGSNMSGKSTLLRTSGINLVLAYAGTSVCAKQFKCSIMDIYTCMRVSDNLEKNISSFYAEILRIKEIVKAADRGEKLYFLLDEIFKGTNSLDRHTGAKVLIKQLSTKNTIGLVSTHDLELGTLEDENPKIKNYHFREYYENNELKFDYILRSGVSTTRNAMYLIKMAGINAES
jgi:DNA mismatch repair ATPase MutS